MCIIELRAHRYWSAYRMMDAVIDHLTLPAGLGGRVDAVVPLVHNAGNAATGGIWRVTGPAGTAVLKVSRPPSPEPVGSPAWQTSDVPAHWNYWRREALAYTTGLTRVYASA